MARRTRGTRAGETGRVESGLRACAVPPALARVRGEAMTAGVSENFPSELGELARGLLEAG
jgi:hypothetical protein